MRALREKDYKKYEWLLEKLNLIYKPMPHDAPAGVLIPRENVERKVVFKHYISSLVISNISAP